MSFMKSLKSLADDFKGMMNDDDKKDKDKKDAIKHDQNRGASDSYYGQQTQSQQSYGQHPPQQYGQPQQHFGGPPPQSHGPPPGGPQLPPGWVQQWDPNSQRYYYLEQATGKSQWEPPVMSPPHDQNRAFGGPPGQGYPGQQYPQQGYGQGYPPQNQAYGGYPPNPAVAHPGGQNFPHEAVKSGEKVKEKKGMGKGGMIAAGAGGLVAGGLLGAAIAGDSSDDEHHSAPHGGYGAPGGGYGGGYGAPPAAGYGDPYGNPQALEHNPELSGSDRESLQEARHEYEKTMADSDASSSDREEAREEYQEEIEEAQEEAYGSD